MRKRLRALLAKAITAARGKDHPGDVDILQEARRVLHDRSPRPYARTTRQGHQLDQLTNYALYAVEHRLGYDYGSLDVLQGSYNPGGVQASAGVHDGGGAVDLSPAHWQDKVHALRQVGFAAWHRPAIPGLWGEHVHAVLIGNVKLSSAAVAQVRAYRDHRNGLKDNAPDPTWHPDPIPVFRMPVYRMES